MRLAGVHDNLRNLHQHQRECCPARNIHGTRHPVADSCIRSLPCRLAASTNISKTEHQTFKTGTEKGGSFLSQEYNTRSPRYLQTGYISTMRVVIYSLGIAKVVSASFPCVLLHCLGSCLVSDIDTKNSVWLSPTLRMAHCVISDGMKGVRFQKPVRHLLVTGRLTEAREFFPYSFLFSFFLSCLSPRFFSKC